MQNNILDKVPFKDLEALPRRMTVNTGRFVENSQPFLYHDDSRGERIYIQNDGRYFHLVGRQEERGTMYYAIREVSIPEELNRVSQAYSLYDVQIGQLLKENEPLLVGLEDIVLLRPDSGMQH